MSSSRSCVKCNSLSMRIGSRSNRPESPTLSRLPWTTKPLTLRRPNPKCGNESAMSDECDRCGARYDPSELIDPRSAISDATPELRETLHWWLDMWHVDDVLTKWISSKAGTWRNVVFNEAINTVLPSFYERFAPAFVTQAKHFVDAVLDDTPFELTMDDAVEATRIAMERSVRWASGWSPGVRPRERRQLASSAGKFGDCWREKWTGSSWRRSAISTSWRPLSAR